MRFADLFRLALANLRRNRSRSGMTLVGVLIGVAALTALLAYGAGVQQNARSEFNRLELYNTLRLTSAPSPFDSFSQFGGVEPRTSARPDSLPPVPLTDSLLQVIGQMDDVLAAFPEFVFPIQLRANGREASASAEAIPMSFAEIPLYQPTTGAFFTAPTDTALLMAPAMAQRLGYENPADIVGQEVIVKTLTLDFRKIQQFGPAMALGLTSFPLDTHHRPMLVAGLIGEDDQPLSGFLRVLLPLERAKNMRKITFFSTLDLLMNTSAPGGYAAARVQLKDNAALEPVRQAIEQTGVYVSATRDQFKQLERLFVIMDLALGIIGFIALLVATIGIANTMMMSVMERTREIGVMKAVGGYEGDLQRLFLVEGATLGMVGGLAGLLFGWGLVALIQIAVDYYLQRLAIPPVDLFYLPVWMIFAILGVTLLVSLLAGVAPARRAARIEPIEALRSA